MNFEVPYFFAFILLALLPLVLWGYIFYSIRKLQEKPKTSHLLIIGGITVLFGIYLGFIHLYSIWLIGYFGILSCLVVPALGFVTLFLLVFKRKSAAESETRLGKPIIGIVLATFILLQILSPFTSRQLANGCDAFHRNQALPLIAAAGQYKSEKGLFPNNHSALVPSYVKEMPSAACLIPIDMIYGTRNDVSRYQVIKCENESAFVVVRTTLFGNEQIYNLVSQKWGQEEDWDNPCDN